jgi:hypothetical protein
MDRWVQRNQYLDLEDLKDLKDQTLLILQIPLKDLMDQLVPGQNSYLPDPKDPKDL